MSARVLRGLGQEILSTVLWLALLSKAHQVELPTVTAVLLALAGGVVIGVVLSFISWWTGKPMTISPGWELTARLAVWGVLTTIVVLAALIAGPAVALGLFAAVIAANGIPTIRQIRALRAGPPRSAARPCQCHTAGQAQRRTTPPPQRSRPYAEVS